MSAFVNYHSFKNRYLLRAYHQTGVNFLQTLLPATLRDLAALARVLLVERSSLEAYRWLWRNRNRLRAKSRRIRSRRLVSRKEIDRWFWTRGLEDAQAARPATVT